MKKRRKIKWGRVLLIIIFPIVIIGGIIMCLKYNDKDNLSNSNNKTTEEETVSNETYVEPIKLADAPTNSSEYQNLNDGEYLTTTGHTLKIENGLAYVEGNLIVNKTYSLPKDYVPVNPNQPITTENCNNCLDIDVIEAFNLMKSDATSIGLNIWVQSGYRSYTYQDGLYNRYAARDGFEKADTYSARPGHSEHQTGLCFDLNSIDDSFATTAEGIWINNNAHVYGFIIRYPKGKEKITGYQYESWHLRYVGKELATKLYNNGNWLTLEEYFGLSSSY